MALLPVTPGRWHQLPQADTITRHSLLLIPQPCVCQPQPPSRRGTSDPAPLSAGHKDQQQHGEPWTRRAAAGTAGHGWPLQMKQHAQAIVVKHLFVQVIEATMFTVCELTTGDTDRDWGLQLLPPEFSPLSL